MLKMNLFPALLFLVILVIQGCGQSKKSPPDSQIRIKRVEENLLGIIRVEGEGDGKRTIEERMAHYKVPGLSIAVIKDYQLDWAKGYGQADVSGNRDVTEQTVFQAASISKSLNAVGLLKLAQDGKIDLNSDINTYLTGWKFPYDDVSKGKKITIANLLSHTGGLSVHGFRGYEPNEPLPAVAEILDGKSPANSDAVRSMFEPGVAMQYSGGGTTITQLIVTEIAHSPYDEFMSTTVLAPMGMDNSFFTQPPPQSKSSVLATAYRQDGSEVKGKFHIYPEQAAAGLWTNPTDLAKYIIETQLALEGKSAKVLNQSFTNIRLTPYVNNVGFGIFISKIDSNEYFGHDGANEGFRCAYLGSMKGGNGVVVMVNSDNGMILQEIVHSVFSVYGWDEFKPITKQIVALTPEQWKSLDGRYELEGDKNMQLQFTSGDDKLTLKQLWDGREVTFEAESEVEFFCRDSVFPLKFTKNTQGESTQVLAFGRDVWVKVKEK
ncbi:MAG TPA: serine hydrolase domain-containing protein [Chryseolinea sp.]|nr:serine hydrolase domain-containing protein [Chryseolinea sp.]